MDEGDLVQSLLQSLPGSPPLFGDPSYVPCHMEHVRLLRFLKDRLLEATNAYVRRPTDYGGGAGGPGKDVGVQAGPSMVGKGGDAGPETMGDDKLLNQGGARSKELPAAAVTSLCEIRFNRKDVK